MTTTKYDDDNYYILMYNINLNHFYFSLSIMLGLDVQPFGHSIRLQPDWMTIWYTCTLLYSHRLCIWQMSPMLS